MDAGAGFYFAFAVLLHFLPVLKGNNMERRDFGIAKNVSGIHTLYVRDGNSGFFEL